MQKISIIIVSWNGKKDTVECIASLQKLVIPKNISCQIFLVDNNSSDNSASEISKKYPYVEVIKLAKNEGFTGGNNRGIARALEHKTDFIWLLNNDTLVHPQALSSLTVFDDPRVGIVGSKIYFASGYEFHQSRYAKHEKGRVFWYAGGKIDWSNMYASHRGVDEVDDGQYEKIEETDFVTGCSMFIKAEVVKKIGFLDPRYYLYLEDVDYCIRAKNAGFSLLYIPQSVIWHKNAGSAGGSGSSLQEYYMTRNRILVGMRFASYRTKIALLREAFKYFFSGNEFQKKAVKDFFTGKFNKQYD